jgi:hypothetical protein
VTETQEILVVEKLDFWTQKQYISLRHVTSAELTVQTKLRNTPLIRVVLSGVDSHSDQFKMTPVCMKHEN